MYGQKFRGDAVVKTGTAACLQFLWETQMCGKSVFYFKCEGMDIWLNL